MIIIFTIEQIIHYDNSYYLKEGILYNSEYDKVILNKETILKYKSSQLLLNVAKSLAINDSNKENKNFNYYIEKAMKLYSANGEVLENSTINRIINSLMNNDRSYEEPRNEENINIYKKFSNSDYFKAYLDLKLRQQGKTLKHFQLDLYDPEDEYIYIGLRKGKYKTEEDLDKLPLREQLNYILDKKYNSNDRDYYHKLYEEINKRWNLEMNEKACIISLSKVANQQVVDYYDNMLKNAKKYDDKIQIIRQINNIIRNDYKKQITNIEEFEPNKPYRLICHSINNIDVEDPTKGYHGTIISCSMLSNEQNGTYKSNYGFVYHPENIITAREGDASINNFAEDIENSSAINTIPMVKSVTELIEKTRNYNEVAIKKAEPIAIFCKADSKEDQAYKNALSLQQKFSHLKIIMLPTKTFTIEESKNNNENFEYLKNLIQNSNDYNLEENLKIYNQLKEKLFDNQKEELNNLIKQKTQQQEEQIMTESKKEKTEQISSQTLIKWLDIYIDKIKQDKLLSLSQILKLVKLIETQKSRYIRLLPYYSASQMDFQILKNKIIKEIELERKKMILNNEEINHLDKVI